MFDQIREQQEAVREQLEARTVEATSGNGLVTVRMSGNKVVRAVVINRDHPDYADPDAVEDHLVLALNEALAEATRIEQETVQAWMSSMLPGGLGALGGLFGGRG